MVMQKRKAEKEWRLRLSEGQVLLLCVCFQTQTDTETEREWSSGMCLRVSDTLQWRDFREKEGRRRRTSFNGKDLRICCSCSDTSPSMLPLHGGLNLGPVRGKPDCLTADWASAAAASGLSRPI
ncbi:hypothetical protein CRG98_034458 [Punica granatum]|uniref:Uncharacterized protein n=1 Tax=Punica granatum TaxID=22663 RepID=A0A2I0IMB6_PUNGR|nr:hypothetical protein CRG98_034458 [Punica granatum]